LGKFGVLPSAWLEIHPKRRISAVWKSKSLLLIEELKGAYLTVEERAAKGRSVSTVLHSIGKLKQQLCELNDWERITAVGRRRSDGELELFVIPRKSKGRR
jgi:hypothetical protein